MNQGWLGLALLAAFLYGVHNAFARAASKGISEELGTIILEATSAIAVLAWVVVRARPLRADVRSVGWAIAAGVAVAGGSVLYFIRLRRGAGLSAMSPVVLAGTTVVTALAGVLAFGEKLSGLRVLGLALVVLGIVLLARK
jgi:uncharacterized membrane protein